jgi:hypothetical protein
LPLIGSAFQDIASEKRDLKRNSKKRLTEYPPVGMINTSWWVSHDFNRNSA